jgi:hypothetical protein
MNVELIRKLRRAGFPLTDLKDIFDRLNVSPDAAQEAETKVPELFPNAYQIAGKWYLSPTFEQYLQNLPNFFYLQKLKDDWMAATHDVEARGKGPLEALCNLYLETKK